MLVGGGGRRDVLLEMTTYMPEQGPKGSSNHFFGGMYETWKYKISGWNMKRDEIPRIENLQRNQMEVFGHTWKKNTLGFRRFFRPHPDFQIYSFPPKTVLVALTNPNTLYNATYQEMRGNMFPQ